jgi:hypothetical protein
MLPRNPRLLWSERDTSVCLKRRQSIPQTSILATALGAVLLAAPTLNQGRDLNTGELRHSDRIILAQGGGGSGADSQSTGGLNNATPGSPAVGNLGSTPQEILGRSQQPAQGAATSLVLAQGRGAPDPSALPGATSTTPGGTAVMPGDLTSQPRR